MENRSAPAFFGVNSAPAPWTATGVNSAPCSDISGALLERSAPISLRTISDSYHKIGLSNDPQRAVSPLTIKKIDICTVRCPKG